jgi:16S rRNA (cytidine1402-2'-O)-methyltransferase
MDTVFGSRHAAVARELTKKFEEIQRGSLTTLVKFYSAIPTPKGEIVVIIDPPSMAMPPTRTLIDSEIMAVLANLGVKSAAEHVSDALGLPRREIYQRALELRGNDKSK